MSDWKAANRASIRIADLVDPQFTADQRAALNFTTTLDISFDEAELLAEARARTQLTDFAERLRGPATGGSASASLDYGPTWPRSRATGISPTWGA
jgi:hypothetical protein